MCPLKWQWASSLKNIKLINHPGFFQSFGWYLDKKRDVLLCCHQFVSAKFQFCKERALGHHGKFSDYRRSGNADCLWKTTCWFSERFLKPFTQILNIVGCFHCTRSTTATFSCICNASSLSNFGHQTFNCFSIRYFVPAKFFPALSLRQNHWFCDKIRPYYFYSLLLSIAPTIIYLAV